MAANKLPGIVIWSGSLTAPKYPKIRISAAVNNAAKTSTVHPAICSFDKLYALRLLSAKPHRVLRRQSTKSDDDHCDRNELAEEDSDTDAVAAVSTVRC